MIPVASDCRDERRGDGTYGNVYACRFTYTAALGMGNEWNFVAGLDNYGSGENCAAYFQARSHGTGPTWAACAEVADFSFGVSGAAMVGQEIDLWTCGRSDGDRLGLHVVVGDASAIHNGKPFAGPCVADTGVLVSNNGHKNAAWATGIAVKDWEWAGVEIAGTGGSFCLRLTGRATVGIDFSALDAQSIVRVREGQRVSLEVTDAVQVGYEVGRVCVFMHGVAMFAVDVHTGDVFVRGEVKKFV